MKYRKRLPRKKSKKMFKKGAMKIHPKNLVRVMRGGYRL